MLSRTIGVPLGTPKHYKIMKDLELVLVRVNETKASNAARIYISLHPVL